MVQLGALLFLLLSVLNLIVVGVPEIAGIVTINEQGLFVDQSFNSNLEKRNNRKIVYPFV